MAGGEIQPTQNGVQLAFTAEGELVVCYPGGMNDNTGIFPSKEERLVIEVFGRTTSGRTLLMHQRGKEIHDPLTSLLRHDPGREVIGERISRIASMPFVGTVSVLVLDLDHFGRINKTHGQSVGDEVLRWFARILTRRTRSSDVVVRWGGEEFVVFTFAGQKPPDADGGTRDRDNTDAGFERTGKTSQDLGPIINNGKIVASRIIHSLEAGPCMIGGVAIDQKVTIGVATKVMQTQHTAEIDGIFEILFEAADRLLRQAKTADKRGQIYETFVNVQRQPA